MADAVTCMRAGIWAPPETQRGAEEASETDTLICSGVPLTHGQDPLPGEER